LDFFAIPANPGLLLKFCSKWGFGTIAKNGAEHIGKNVRQIRNQFYLRMVRHGLRRLVNISKSFGIAITAPKPRIRMKAIGRPVNTAA
jgi:hypothetical protein